MQIKYKNNKKKIKNNQKFLQLLYNKISYKDNNCKCKMAIKFKY